ncbi:MAG TPA: DUF47 family protein [Anaerolineae bacterium]
MLPQFLRNFARPRQDIFYQLLIEQADYSVQAADMVLEYLEKPGKKRRKKTRQIEKAADDVRRRLVAELNSTFITPIDREDIHALSRNLDDVVDYAYTTTEELELFGIEPNESLTRLASMVKEGAVELLQGMQHLKENPELANEHAQRAKKIETYVERVYRQTLADLFVPPEDLKGVVEILKLREVYRHLSNAADRIDEAANILSDIVVKMT